MSWPHKLPLGEVPNFHQHALDQRCKHDVAMRPRIASVLQDEAIKFGGVVFISRNEYQIGFNHESDKLAFILRWKYDD